MELPKASCKPCEKITHRFEYTCARQIFGKFRIRHNLPTRRRKERPTHLTAFTAGADGTNIRPITVRAQDYPTELFLYTFKLANVLSGMPAHVNTLDWNVVGINSHDEMVAFEKKHGGAFATQVRFQPIEFGRMLAKIGHSYAVASLGINSFRPLALDVILGRTDNISHVVGAHPKIEEPVEDAGHVLSVEYRVQPHKREALILVQIRLFASLNTPTYHVVVGDVKDVEHVRTLLQKMQSAQTIEVLLPE